jgi:hypothetical protein
MDVTSRISPTVWLKTDRPVVSTNPAAWSHVGTVQSALQDGVAATVDMKRPEFYEIEVGNDWYYVHIPSRIPGAYLIAVGRKSPADSVAAQTAAMNP